MGSRTSKQAVPRAQTASESTPLAASKSEEGASQSDATPMSNGRTSLLGATAILATFSTTSSNVQYPFTYGQLGVVLGPLLGVMLQGLMCALSVLTCRVAIDLECKTFGEVGFALGGKWGGRLLRGVQLLNNLLFMPVALVLSGDALQDVIISTLDCDSGGNRQNRGSCDYWSCNINALWPVLLFAWPVLLLARDVGELTWNSYISVILIVVQTIFLLDAAVESEPVGGPSTITPYSYAGPGYPGSTWYNILAAIGTFLYSFAPLFIAVEVLDSMQTPSEIVPALYYSFAFNLAAYIPYGIVAVTYWGGSIPNPSTDWLTGAAAVSANAILFYCTFLDFAIAGSVVNHELQQAWFPSFDRKCSWRNLPMWLLITLPSLIFALILSLVVPRLSSLTGLLDSLCIPIAMLGGVPAMLLLLLVRAQRHRAPWPELDVVIEMARRWVPYLVAGVVLGSGLLVAILTETFYSIFVETDFTGDFFCEVIGS